MSTFSLELHNRRSTHKSNHTLDAVLTRCSELDIIKSFNTIRDVPSDHFCITCIIDFLRPKTTKSNTSFRKIKDIDRNCFLTEVEKVDFDSDTNSVEEMVIKFNYYLSTIQITMLRLSIELYSPDRTHHGTTTV